MSKIMIDNHEFYGTDVGHGLKYLENLRPDELREMIEHARKSSDRDHHFEAHIPGKSGPQHYVLIYKNDGTYELRYKS